MVLAFPWVWASSLDCWWVLAKSRGSPSLAKRQFALFVGHWMQHFTCPQMQASVFWLMPTKFAILYTLANVFFLARCVAKHSH